MVERDVGRSYYTICVCDIDLLHIPTQDKARIGKGVVNVLRDHNVGEI
jgi:hypothetical protein